MELGDWYLTIVPVLIGVGMLGFWIFAVATRRVSEIESGGVEIRFHIAAEVATGLVLIVGGLAVLTDEDAPSTIFLSAFGLGMLAYTLIVSPGYFVERRDARMAWMFAGFWVLMIPAIVLRFFGT